MEVGEWKVSWGNPDAVEFCPHSPFQSLLAVSTYTLLHHPPPDIRRGSLSLFHVVDSYNDADSSSCNNNNNNKKKKHQLELVQCIDTSAGIFDIKWAPLAGSLGPLLAHADSDGSVRVSRVVSDDSCQGEMVNEEYTKYILREITDEQVSSSMCLCIDWDPSSTSISVGLSNGSVSVTSFSESRLSIKQEWKAHDFEVWASSFDTHQPQLVYTGADDCKFICWDLRECPSTIAFQNTKTHTMGVCCITKSPNDPYTLLTGSYDEYLRVWDMRSMVKPLSETSICLGGGVWRIKHHPYVPGVVLAACMHNGFSVVKIDGEKAEVVESYDKHQSLAYGADWQRGEYFRDGKRKRSVVATCSFYDRLLRVWMPKSDILL